MRPEGRGKGLVVGSCPGLSTLARPAAWASQRRDNSANDCLFEEGVHGDWLKWMLDWGDDPGLQKAGICLYVIRIIDYF